MGKKDAGQRTKGNTKPSSSARSAELLLQSGLSAETFSSGSDFGASVAPIFGLTALRPEEEALIPSQVTEQENRSAAVITIRSQSYDF
jgi:hypothetical protein